MPVSVWTRSTVGLSALRLILPQKHQRPNNFLAIISGPKERTTRSNGPYQNHSSWRMNSMANPNLNTDELKTCIKCADSFPLSSFYKNHRNGRPRARCKTCMNKYRSKKRYIRKDPALHQAQIVRAKRSRRYRLRVQVISGYGGKCVCCSEDNYGFLTVDHVHNNGSEERSAGIAQETLYKLIIQRNFPPDYQILCYNCNCGRARFGMCPHLIAA